MHARPQAFRHATSVAGQRNFVHTSADGCLPRPTRGALFHGAPRSEPRCRGGAMSRATTTVSTFLIFVLAINLRPAVTSLGAALPDISIAGDLVGAVLVALPLWAIGLGGWGTLWLC